MLVFWKETLLLLNIDVNIFINVIFLHMVKDSVENVIADSLFPQKDVGTRWVELPSVLTSKTTLPSLHVPSEDSQAASQSCSDPLTPGIIHQTGTKCGKMQITKNKTSDMPIYFKVLWFN